MKPKFKILDELRTWNADQSWHARQHFSATVEGKTRKFRLNLRRNAYDNQSFARMDALDPATLQWHTLVSRPIQHTSAARISYVDKVCDLAAVGATRDVLIDDAQKVLS